MNPEMKHAGPAVVRTSGADRGHLFLHLYSDDAGWSMRVLDDKLRPVTQAFGQRKGDVWAEVENKLRRRGLLGS
jgi:hypothetical protein